MNPHKSESHHGIDGLPHTAPDLAGKNAAAGLAADVGVEEGSRHAPQRLDLHRLPLLSAEFVRASRVTAELLGEFALKAVGALQPIFGVIE